MREEARVLIARGEMSVEEVRRSAGDKARIVDIGLLPFSSTGITYSESKVNDHTIGYRNWKADNATLVPGSVASGEI